MAPVSKELQTLLSKARAGDRKAFEAIIRICQRKIYGIAWRMTRDHADAEDISQEVFIRAFEALGELRSGRPEVFEAWLRRTTINLCINMIKSGHAKREVPASSLPSGVGEPVDTLTPADALARKEKADIISCAIAELSADHRTVIVLHEIEGLTTSQISETLECPIGTVLSRLYYARRYLRKKLRPFLAEEGKL